MLDPNEAWDEPTRNLDRTARKLATAGRGRAPRQLGNVKDF